MVHPATQGELFRLKPLKEYPGVPVTLSLGTLGMPGYVTNNLPFHFIAAQINVHLTTNLLLAKTPIEDASPKILAVMELSLEEQLNAGK